MFPLGDPFNPEGDSGPIRPHGCDGGYPSAPSPSVVISRWTHMIRPCCLRAPIPIRRHMAWRHQGPLTFDPTKMNGKCFEIGDSRVRGIPIGA